MVPDEPDHTSSKPGETLLSKRADEQSRLRFRDWANLQYALLWAYSGPVPREALSGNYSDDAVSCWLILKGGVQLKTGDQDIRVSSGNWVFVASPERYQNFEPETQLLSIHFDLFWPGFKSVYDRSINRVMPAACNPKLQTSAKRLVGFLNKSFPGTGAYLPSEFCSYADYLSVQSRFPNFLEEYIASQELLGVTPARRLEQSDQVLHCLRELDRLPLDHRFSQQEISERLGMSRSHLDKVFSKEMGTTPRKYLEARRLKTAVHLIHRTENSIKLIAVEMGFRHESHFCSWFKRMTGRRPSELRS